jgi:hypothetical protein
MPWERMFPDYITYWTAGKLVASGHSPYDVSLQAAIQRELGWERFDQGRGVLDFLPYYYPPWFALGCTLLLPLGFDGGKLAWFFLNVELAFLSGLLLRAALPGLPRSIALVAVPLFLFTLLAVLLGQTTVLILFFASLAWSLLERGRDRAAGVALALLSTKPQLAVILLLAVGLWAARRGRWGVAWGFVATLAVLCLLSTLFIPSWPFEMLAATGRTPPPTEAFPWLGNTWFLVLKTLGLQGWALWVLYLVVALPLLLCVVWVALDPKSPLRDVFALGALSVFFVIPYARHYDFVVLLIPCFVLLVDRLSARAGAALLVLLIVIPYLQFAALVRYSRLVVPEVNFFLECTYFWVPALLASLWIGSERDGPTAESATHDIPIEGSA